MASRRISILESFLSGGSVGKSFRSSLKAWLKDSTLSRSRKACAVRYFTVARRKRLFCSRESFTDPLPVVLVTSALLLSSFISFEVITTPLFRRCRVTVVVFVFGTFSGLACPLLSAGYCALILESYAAVYTSQLGDVYTGEFEVM